MDLTMRETQVIVKDRKKVDDDIVALCPIWG